MQTWVWWGKYCRCFPFRYLPSLSSVFQLLLVSGPPNQQKLLAIVRLSILRNIFCHYIIFSWIRGVSLFVGTSRSCGSTECGRLDCSSSVWYSPPTVSTSSEPYIFSPSQLTFDLKTNQLRKWDVIDVILSHSKQVIDIICSHPNQEVKCTCQSNQLRAQMFPCQSCHIELLFSGFSRFVQRPSSWTKLPSVELQTQPICFHFLPNAIKT